MVKTGRGTLQVYATVAQSSSLPWIYRRFKNEFSHRGSFFLACGQGLAKNQSPHKKSFDAEPESTLPLDGIPHSPRGRGGAGFFCYSGYRGAEFAHSVSCHERRSTHKKSFAADLDSTLPYLPNEPRPIHRLYRDCALRWDTQSGVSVFQRLRSTAPQD